MKRKIMIAACLALMLYILTGWQLAQEDADMGEDKLVGIFVTNDNLSSFRSGEITVDGNTQKYQGRLYATLTTRTLTSEETGETFGTEEYVFEGIEGIAYFSPTIPATAEYDSYIASVSDEAISDGHMSLNYGDDETSITLEGTIYTSPSNKQHKYYFNPVYQSADGSVYTVSGSGFMVNESNSEGSVYSHTLDTATTVTENGKLKIDSTSIKLSISVMFAPEKIVVLQMDAESGLLSRMEYVPDEMPEVFMPDAATSYLIVETYKRDDTGSPKTSRAIYGRDAERIETFSVRSDGICVKHWTKLQWENSSGTIALPSFSYCSIYSLAASSPLITLKAP